MVETVVFFGGCDTKFLPSGVERTSYENFVEPTKILFWKIHKWNSGGWFLAPTGTFSSRLAHTQTSICAPATEKDPFVFSQNIFKIQFVTNLTMECKCFFFRFQRTWTFTPPAQILPQTVRYPFWGSTRKILDEERINSIHISFQLTKYFI